LLCQLEVPLEATVEAFRIARAAGVRTVLTPSPVCELPEELLQLTDVCVLNEREAVFLAGPIRRGPAEVIVTLGERGCLLSGPEGDAAFAAPFVSAVDTTGAGDAFVGALAAGLAGGVPLRDAIPRAIVAAALSVTRAGAQASYPSRAEVEAFLSTGAVPR
jgi:ribokinase